MFLHLGNGVSVRTKDVIAIQDYTVFQNEPGKRLLEKKRQEGRVINTLDLGPKDEAESIKSLILTEDYIYLSVISSLTLKRRSDLAFNKRLSEAADKTMESSDSMIME